MKLFNLFKKRYICRERRAYKRQGINIEIEEYGMFGYIKSYNYPFNELYFNLPTNDKILKINDFVNGIKGNNEKIKIMYCESK